MAMFNRQLQKSRCDKRKRKYKKKQNVDKTRTFFQSTFPRSHILSIQSISFNGCFISNCSIYSIFRENCFSIERKKYEQGTQDADVSHLHRQNRFFLSFLFMSFLLFYFDFKIIQFHFISHITIIT